MFSDAIDREADWLNTIDDLPTLNPLSGSPFGIVQARWPRIPSTRKRGLYVLRRSAKVVRFSSQRTMLTTRFMVKLYWPLSTGNGSAEDEQLLFDQAIDAVLARIQGPLGDKTHGGRFLSIAEEGGIDIDQSDPSHPDGQQLFEAVITYSGDDVETNN